MFFVAECTGHEVGRRDIDTRPVPGIIRGPSSPPEGWEPLDLPFARRTYDNVRRTYEGAKIAVRLQMVVPIMTYHGIYNVISWLGEHLPNAASRGRTPPILPFPTPVPLPI
jgi:hypothetical protein